MKFRQESRDRLPNQFAAVRHHELLVVPLAPVEPVLGYGGPAGSAKEGEQDGKILSVRKILRNQYFLSRYPQIHYYMLYISLTVSDQTYCTEYETPVLD